MQRLRLSMQRLHVTSLQQSVVKSAERVPQRALESPNFHSLQRTIPIHRVAQLGEKVSRRPVFFRKLAGFTRAAHLVAGQVARFRSGRVAPAAPKLLIFPVRRLGQSLAESFELFRRAVFHLQSTLFNSGGPVTVRE